MVKGHSNQSAALVGNTPALDVGQFQTLGCAAAVAILDRLIERTAEGCGRVRITGADPDTVCVLISEAELKSLDQAIAILSATEGAERMREQLVELARSVGMPVHPLYQPSEATRESA
ncbi:MAG: hypothetical protein JO353_11800 [Phycisphaerae bacterium]|nr:hypothetical protein [Phycisphaerae bacterium]